MNLLVCGTRKRGYAELVWKELDAYRNTQVSLEIIEGCCPDSADQYAEEWALKNNVKVHHYPGTQGTYLARNIEMVKACDAVIAFHDNYSYGTAQCVAYAVYMKKHVRVIKI